MAVLVLGYRGKSLISKLIRWQTRSQYSHVSVEIDGQNYEAWHIGGVVRRSWNEGHTSGTQVDVLRPVNTVNVVRMRHFLEQQIGKGYDYKGVLRFLSRRDERLDNRWFCSELVAQAFIEGMCVLQNMRPSYLTPRDICMSPQLTVVGRRIV